MEKTKLLTVAVIGLLLLNVGLLTFMWLGRRHPMPPPPDKNGQNRPPAAAFLINELKLDEEQTANYDAMRLEHRHTRDSLEQILRENREIVFKNFASDDTTIFDKIAAVQKQMDMSTFQHFRAVRAICRPEQQTIFDNVIGEALKIMAQQQRPPMQPEQGPPPHH